MFAMDYLPPQSFEVWKTQLQRGHVIPAHRCRGWPEHWRAFTAVCRISCRRGEICYRRDLPCDPTRTVPVGNRARTSRPCCGSGEARRNDRAHQADLGAWRCQPEEHPRRAAGPGLHRCRMRVVRRSRLRPRLLPQSSAAQMPVGALGRRRDCWQLSTASPKPTSAVSIGSQSRKSIAGRLSCFPASFSPAIDGKSPVEYLTEERDKNTVRRVARSLLAAPPDRLAEIRQRVGERDRRVTDEGCR